LVGFRRFDHWQPRPGIVAKGGEFFHLSRPAVHEQLVGAAFPVGTTDSLMALDQSERTAKLVPIHIAGAEA